MQKYQNFTIVNYDSRLKILIFYNNRARTGSPSLFDQQILLSLI